MRWSNHLRESTTFMHNYRSPSPRRRRSRLLRPCYLIMVAISSLATTLRFSLLMTVVPTNHGRNKFASTDGTIKNQESTLSSSTSKNSNNRRETIQIDITGDGSSSWTESHSPNNHQTTPRNDNVRISFRLLLNNHDPNPTTQFLSVQNYKCHGALPPSLRPRRILGFDTKIATSLKILFLGDSVSQQFAQGFYGSALGEDDYGGHVVLDGFENGATRGLHVQTSMVAPCRGGGVIVFWRALGLMSDATAGWGYANYMKEEGETLKKVEYVYPAGGERKALVRNEDVSTKDKIHFRSEVVRGNNSNGNGNDTTTTTFEVGEMDACIVRLPHGWIELTDMTRDAIIQHVDHAHVISGCTTVVLSTLPFNNNVKTLADWRTLIDVNQMIRDVARSWNGKPSNTVSNSSQYGKDGGKEDDGGGVNVVLVQEFGNFTNQILYKNAQFIGYNISSMPDFAQEDNNDNGRKWEEDGMWEEFLQHRYLPHRMHPPSVSMVCGHVLGNWSIRNETTTDVPCYHNGISTDGMHWCVESLGSRYAASVACLLGCVYNNNNNNNNNNNGKKDNVGQETTARGYARLRRCERECNNRFMSLVPVEESWIGNNMTIFSD